MFVDISPGPVDYSKALVVFRGTDNCCYSSEESISQSLWKSDSLEKTEMTVKVLKPNSAQPLSSSSVSHVFLPAVESKRKACCLFPAHVCWTLWWFALIPAWTPKTSERTPVGKWNVEVNDACRSPLIVVDISTCINCTWIICSFTLQMKTWT